MMKYYDAILYLIRVKACIYRYYINRQNAMLMHILYIRIQFIYLMCCVCIWNSLDSMLCHRHHNFLYIRGSPDELYRVPSSDSPMVFINIKHIFSIIIIVYVEKL